MDPYINLTFYILFAQDKTAKVSREVSQIMPEDDFIKDMQNSFKHKFAKKPEVIEGNMQAIKMALQEIKELQ